MQFHFALTSIFNCSHSARLYSSSSSSSPSFSSLAHTWRMIQKDRSPTDPVYNEFYETAIFRDPLPYALSPSPPPSLSRSTIVSPLMRSLLTLCRAFAAILKNNPQPATVPPPRSWALRTLLTIHVYLCIRLLSSIAVRGRPDRRRHCGKPHASRGRCQRCSVFCLRLLLLSADVTSCS